MRHSVDLDYLIIGQGLAGSLLAWRLICLGQKVLVIDNGRVNASKVAAGLINPVTGIRLVKAPETEQQLTTATTFYQTLENHFAKLFFQAKPMLRIIRNANELAYCQKRLKSEAYRPFLDTLGQQHASPQVIHAPMGILRQKQTGYLLTRPLLEQLKTFFKQRDCYQETDFLYPELNIGKNGLSWQQFRARKIIFCEGHRTLKNPWFSWLPMQPVKGEILTFSSTAQLPNAILNYGHWLIPIGQQTYRTGATFDRDHIDTCCTEAGKQTLLSSLKKVCPGFDDLTITEHLAHIRPGTIDRKPLLGVHPRHPQLIIFNGFGAKGSLLIPWYSQHLVNWLLKQVPLPSSCDILRFHDSHFPA